MPTIQVEAEVSEDKLLQAVGQLGSSELEEFVAQVLALQAQRRAPSLPREEVALLLEINQGIPVELQSRYDELVNKRRAEQLTSDEYSELLRLTEEVERRDVQRVERLVELAQRRGVTLNQLMRDLGIEPLTHA